MTQSNLAAQESTSSLVLVEPSQFSPKGDKAIRRLQSKQDLIEAIGWGSLIWVTLTFLLDGGANALVDQNLVQHMQMK